MCGCRARFRFGSVACGGRGGSGAAAVVVAGRGLRGAARLLRARVIGSGARCPRRLAFRVPRRVVSGLPGRVRGVRVRRAASSPSFALFGPPEFHKHRAHNLSTNERSGASTTRPRTAHSRGGRHVSATDRLDFLSLRPILLVLSLRKPPLLERALVIAGSVPLRRNRRLLVSGRGSASLDTTRSGGRRTAAPCAYLCRAIAVHGPPRVPSAKNHRSAVRRAGPIPNLSAASPQGAPDMIALGSRPRRLSRRTSPCPPPRPNPLRPLWLDRAGDAHAGTRRLTDPPTPPSGAALFPPKHLNV